MTRFYVDGVWVEVDTLIEKARRLDELKSLFNKGYRKVDGYYIVPKDSADEIEKILGGVE